MELTDRKIEKMQRQPILETFITMSEDGKWLIHKTVITDIKPMAYMKNVMKIE